MKFKVEINETYKGSQHYHVSIYPPGYGSEPIRFKLVPWDALSEDTQEMIQHEAHRKLGDGLTWRPEYAKAIKKALESVDFW